MQIITGGKIPIKVWAENPDRETLYQAENLAILPFARLWIAIMPDAHVGFGMPIGGVLATDGYVIPNAVGVDIGCGMKARKTNLKEVDRERLKKILNQIQRDIPTGFSHHTKPQNVSKVLLDTVFEFSDKVPSLKKVFDGIPYQIGTLGGGNHFIEIQKGDDGYIWIMLHSGSRGIGKKICDYYNHIAKKNLDKEKIRHPFDLAYLSTERKYGKEYLEAMSLCMRFAEENRTIMLTRIIGAMEKFYPNLKVEDAIDTHHNYASLEKHFGNKYLIHRKGAVHAKGRVIIPGSMGSWSYIAQGLENDESFHSCSHGAGRRLSRRQAFKIYTSQQVLTEMKKKGIELYKVKKSDVAEECTSAYKNIDEVMENQKDLVRPLIKLKPTGVVKG